MVPPRGTRARDHDAGHTRARPRRRTSSSPSTERGSGRCGTGAAYHAALSEGRDPGDGSLLGDSVDPDPHGHVVLLSCATRGDLYAVTGYTGPDGSYDLFTALAEFGAGNAPPVVDDGPRAGTALAAIGESVSFTIAAHDPDDDAISVTWEFGDGSSATGTTAAHVYTTAGTHHVTATVSDAGDEVRRTLDVVVGEPFVAPRLRASLDFRKPGRDQAAVKCSLALAADFDPDGREVAVDIGGVEHTFTLDAKGRARSDSGRVTLEYKKRKALWTLDLRLKAGEFAAEWEDEGLVDETSKKVPVSVKVTLTTTADDHAIRCAHLVGARYTAKQGKWGRTK